MTGFGSAALAGPFAGGGVMLGSNVAALAQALSEPLVRWIAVMPTSPYAGEGKRLVVWQPPEWQTGRAIDSPHALVMGWNALGWIGQAESQAQWDYVIHTSKGRELTVRRGIVCNYWGYGKPRDRKGHTWPRGWVAMPEVYTNQQANLDGPYLCQEYREAGAACVVPVLGGWSNDNDAPNQYRRLKGLGLPGICVYAGEDPITPEILAVCRELWAS